MFLPVRPIVIVIRYLLVSQVEHAEIQFCTENEKLVVSVLKAVPAVAECEMDTTSALQ